MKVFVTGACGQLGHAVMEELAKRGHFPIGSDIHMTSEFPNYVRLDITDAASVDKVLRSIEPDVVIHCAAWTRVDDAED